jgi:hypothetical protein
MNRMRCRPLGRGPHLSKGGIDRSGSNYTEGSVDRPQAVQAGGFDSLPSGRGGLGDSTPRQGRLDIACYFNRCLHDRYSIYKTEICKLDAATWIG